MNESQWATKHPREVFQVSLIIGVLMCSSLNLMGQEILESKLDGSETGESLIDFLENMEKDGRGRFFYLSEWIAGVYLQDTNRGETLEQALTRLFEGRDLTFFAMYPNSVVILKDPGQALMRRNALENALQQNKKVDRFVFGESGATRVGNVTIRGQVRNAKTKEPMPQINILVNETSQGTTTDELGTFQLSLSPGAYILNFSFVNFESKVIDLVAFADGNLDLEMDELAIMLDEVVIQNQTVPDLTTSRVGQMQFQMQEIKRAPAFLGEVDLVKQVQNLPGVTTVGEAASGFNVRGGSVDQNLILYDGLPLFNSAHVFGFLSSFNSEAIHEVSFFRGAIPAEYGGRVSSVLDIHSKDGDYKQWSVNGGVGMITGNFMINGPLQKGKTAMVASLRSTYSNWLVNSVRTDYVDLRDSKVFFYDATLKFTHLFNERTKASFSTYSSKDAFRLVGDSLYQWNSSMGSIKLDYQVSSALSAEFILGRTSYSYDVRNEEPLTESTLSFRINSTTLKALFNYNIPNHNLDFGWQLFYYRFNPGALKPTTERSNARAFSLDWQYSIENALFISDSWALNDQLSVETGLRIPLFTSFGRASINLYRDNQPRDIGNITDTLKYKSGEAIKTYIGLEPRFSARWTTSPTASFKLGFHRMYQNLHLITNSTAVTPVDIWQPSGYYFKPQRADQISVGYFKNTQNRNYGFSAEVYYKRLDNILDFKDGARLILNPNLETELLQGKGESYGLEVFVEKNTGRLKGSINYTYSRSFRIVKGNSAAESVNLGKRYPANFDQPHVANLSWKYNLSRRYFFTGNFTYHTGRPITIPLSAFAFENSTTAYFSQRNQYRIPDYHRLDLALVIEGNHKQHQSWKGTWVFSVYNVYARKNPYTIFFRSSDAGVPQPYQLSVIGTILPSVSYNFRFR